ncbi:MAG: hypothetical protein LQ343_002517 [Gyalolechia ehrenbergii]|nr:MAG: hypothetical protein LQ343_002517 [Gyalolechia ehrenbergii]
MAGYAYGSRHDWDGSLDAAGHDSIYPDPSNPDPLTCPIDDAGYETDVERFIVDRTGRKDEFGAELEDDTSMVGYSIGDSNTTDMFGDEAEFHRIMRDDDDEGEETEREGASVDTIKIKQEEDDSSELSSPPPEYSGYQSSDTGFADPSLPSGTNVPGPGSQTEAQEQVSEFLRRWSSRSWHGQSEETKDRYFIKHATRWGMSPKAIASSGILQTGRKDPPGVRYRIRLLKGAHKDVRPRTKSTAWREFKRSRNEPRTPKQQERENLLQAIKNGMTVQDIVAANIVTLSTNTVAAVRHRWDSFIRDGMILPAIR